MKPVSAPCPPETRGKKRGSHREIRVGGGGKNNTCFCSHLCYSALFLLPPLLYPPWGGTVAISAQGQELNLCGPRFPFAPHLHLRDTWMVERSLWVKMGLTLKFSSVIEMYWLEITPVTKTSLGLSFPLCKMETETPRSHNSEDEMRWRAPQRASTEQTLPSEWVFPTDCGPTRKLLELLVTQYPRPFLERRASIHPPPQLTGQRRAGSTNHILSSWTVDLGLRSRRRPCGRGSWGGGGSAQRGLCCAKKWEKRSSGLESAHAH